MTARDALAAIRERAEAATEGPWEVTGLTADGGYSVDTAARNNFRYEVVPEAIEEDAEFIAHARTDVPALVGALEAIAEANGRYMRGEISGTALSVDVHAALTALEGR